METAFDHSNDAASCPFARVDRAAATDLASLERLLGAPARAWAPIGVPPFAHVEIEPGRTVYHEGQSIASLYLIHAGSAKVVRNEDDGYEQVCDFVGPGDLLGVESMMSGVYAHSVVALTAMTVWAIPLRLIAEYRERFVGFDQQLRSQLCRRVARLEALVWQMSAIGAERRLARFIVRLVEEARRRGQSVEHFHLPMSRRDIASHLGLAHESISRALTSLTARRLLGVRLRDLVVLDLDGIVDFARCTRGSPREEGAASPSTSTSPTWWPAQASDLATAWRHAA